jgi:hypothetical protein
MKTTQKSLFALLLLSTLFNACTKPADVTPTDENEVITTATLQLTNKTAPSDIVTATIDNLNTTPTSATLTLKPNTPYTARVLLSNKTTTPVTDVSKAILDEANDHFFTFTATGANLTVNITDRDTKPAPGPFPIGLTSDMVTGAASTGSLRVILKHQPGAKNGTFAPGTTDLDVTFPVVIR